MSATLPESVVQAVRKRFLKKDRAHVLGLLSEYQCADASLRERVLCCVVSLAGRDIERLVHFLGCAREDHRNLILWYEHAEQSRNQFFKT